jgi:hypothetical protein
MATATNSNEQFAQYPGMTIALRRDYLVLQTLRLTPLVLGYGPGVVDDDDEDDDDVVDDDDDDDDEYDAMLHPSCSMRPM